MNSSLNDFRDKLCKKRCVCCECGDSHHIASFFMETKYCFKGT